MFPYVNFHNACVQICSDNEKLKSCFISALIDGACKYVAYVMAQNSLNKLFVPQIAPLLKALTSVVLFFPLLPPSPLLFYCHQHLPHFIPFNLHPSFLSILCYSHARHVSLSFSLFLILMAISGSYNLSPFSATSLCLSLTHTQRAGWR